MLAAAFVAMSACGDSTDKQDGWTTACSPMLVRRAAVHRAHRGLRTRLRDLARATSPVVPSLDVKRIALDNARELDGRASVYTMGDWLSHRELLRLPRVDRFEVQARRLAEGRRDASISRTIRRPQYFAIDAWGAVFVNAEKAYIFNNLDGSHIVWNPTTIEITGRIPGLTGMVIDGYSLREHRLRARQPLVPALHRAELRLLGVLARAAVPGGLRPREGQAASSLVEDRRAARSSTAVRSSTSAGDIYFSGWMWTPGLTLTSDYPAELRAPHQGGTRTRSIRSTSSTSPILRTGAKPGCCATSGTARRCSMCSTTSA